jgi:anaerobic selenocysteine-containing dehydrogenase
VPWAAYLGHYDRIRDDIERVIPGFEQYNERARERGGFYLPNTARANAYPTPTGRARFTLAQVEPLALAPGELVMMSLRSHDQFNTTIYGLDDRYRGIRSERRVLFLHPDDAAERGLVEGDVVDLVNTHGGIRRVARTFLVVPYDIPLRCCATYYPEANVLVPIDSVAEKSNTPTSKFVVIQLEKQEKSGPPDGDPDAD